MVERYLIWCAGADAEVLGWHPIDAPKVLGLGGAVLTTFVLAAVSWTLARPALGLSLPAALCSGFFLGVVALVLDRWLLAESFQRRTTLGRQLAAFLPRLLLAVGMGTVISEPLVLRTFEPTIEWELVAMLAEERAATEVELRSAPAIADLTERLEANERQLDAVNASLACEIQGACADSMAGSDGVRRPLDDRRELLLEHDHLVAARDAAIAEQLSPLADERHAPRFLARHEGLDRIAVEDDTLRLAVATVRLLLVAVSAMPLLMAFLLTLFSPSPAER